MKATVDRALARRVHQGIRLKLAQLQRSKIEVYFLLRAFKRSRLYRLLDVPISVRHAARVCAPRRFPTWEDYLASLSPELGLSHWNFLHHVRRAWEGSRGGPELSRAPFPLPARDVEAA